MTSISRHSKELSKASVRCCSYDFLFGKVTQIIIKASVTDFIFSEFPPYSSEHLYTHAPEVRQLFFEVDIILDIKTIFGLQKPYCKNF